MRTRLVTLFLLQTFVIYASVVDRVAVVVGKQVITASEVDEEVRVTEFENKEPLDLGAAKRREAAERLVDQLLIRNEMQLEGVQQPAASEADTLLENLRRGRFSSESLLDAALRQYGVTRDLLKQHLLWQLAAVRFVDFRFRGPSAAAPQSESPPQQSADRLGAAPGPPEAESSDAQLDAWLKDARSQTRIEFKKEAFQ
jgi:parvulin-like peptidyl-prolyl isomerase